VVADRNQVGMAVRIDVSELHLGLAPFQGRGNQPLGGLDVGEGLRLACAWDQEEGCGEEENRGDGDA